MKDILIHYGVKGMKWGVRKQYEGTGGGGGGGWGPNTIAGGGGPSPLAASMAGNPKKKKKFGKAEAKKMGIQDNAKKEAEARKQKAKEEGTKDAAELSKNLAEMEALDNAVKVLYFAGADIPDDLAKNYYDAIDRYVDHYDMMEMKYSEMIKQEYVTEKGKDYVKSSVYDWDNDSWYESLYEIPTVKFTEKK